MNIGALLLLAETCPGYLVVSVFRYSISLKIFIQLVLSEIVFSEYWLVGFLFFLFLPIKECFKNDCSTVITKV